MVQSPNLQHVPWCPPGSGAFRSRANSRIETLQQKHAQCSLHFTFSSAQSVWTWQLCSVQLRLSTIKWINIKSQFRFAAIGNSWSMSDTECWLFHHFPDERWGAYVWNTAVIESTFISRAWLSDFETLCGLSHGLSVALHCHCQQKLRYLCFIRDGSPRWPAIHSVQPPAFRWDHRWTWVSEVCITVDTVWLIWSQWLIVLDPIRHLHGIFNANWAFNLMVGLHILSSVCSFATVNPPFYRGAASKLSGLTLIIERWRKKIANILSAVNP